MDAQLIDGRATAAALRRDVAEEVRAMAATGKVPGLAVVLVGEDPASQVYMRAKLKATREAGIAAFEHRLPVTTGEPELLRLLAEFNADPQVHGVLVQLPLPVHINAARVVEAIDPAKDVDGFHPENVGRLQVGRPWLVPCTPLGCLRLIRSVCPQVAGLEALVIGRSNIVGQPMAQMLLQADCSVTIAHSKSRDLGALCRRADLVVAAVGRPEFVRGDWIKPGAIVIDVGINRTASGLVGDVHFETARRRAGAITPVPGGVGPMTIACLLGNTVQAAWRGLPRLT